MQKATPIGESIPNRYTWAMATIRFLLFVCIAACGADIGPQPEGGLPSTQPDESVEQSRLTITSPEDGAVYENWQTIELATDTVNGATIEWHSSIDGLLGRGEMQTTRLSVGRHTISVRSDRAESEVDVEIIEEQTIETVVLGTPANDRSTQVAIAPDRSFYIAGDTDGEFQQTRSEGGQDVFVHKLDHNGIRQWTHQFGSEEHDELNGIAAGHNGVVLVGQVRGDFLDQEHVRGFDAVVLSLNSDGEVVFTNLIGGPGDEAFSDVVILPDGDIIAVGEAESPLFTMQFTPPPTPFAVQFSPTGMIRWATQLPFNGRFTSIDVGPDGRLGLAGYGFQEDTGLDVFVLEIVDGIDSPPLFFGTDSQDAFPDISYSGTDLVIAFQTHGMFAPSDLTIGQSQFAIIHLDENLRERGRAQYPDSAGIDVPRLVTTPDTIYVGGAVIPIGSQLFRIEPDLSLREIETLSEGRFDGVFGTALFENHLYLSGQVFTEIDGKPTSGFLDSFLKAVPLR